MDRIFVIGDIHGAYRALRQCLERAVFDYETDHLISLGDVCDGWPETKSCIDELLRIKHLTYLLGNHDQWLLEWMRTGRIERIWYTQGGEATLLSYKKGVPAAHQEFLGAALPYYILGNKLFVHAGIDPSQPVTMQTTATFLWDRDLARAAIRLYGSEVSGKLTAYDEVYIGHTPITLQHPIQSCEIWMMDTGAGWSGVLSMMDIETKEVFISDTVPSLYPGVSGRSRSIG